MSDQKKEFGVEGGPEGSRGLSPNALPNALTEREKNSQSFFKPDHNQTFEAKTSVGLLLRSALGTADGLLLFILSAAFLIIAFVPSVIEQLTRSYCAQIAIKNMSAAFLLMPLALIAEYFWFSVGKPIGKTSALRFLVLLATAFIPFLKPCLG